MEQLALKLNDKTYPFVMSNGGNLKDDERQRIRERQLLESSESMV